MANNPRTSNGHRRREIVKWVRATQTHCALCGKPIDWSVKYYVDPRDGKRKLHPMSGEVDEIVPVSRGGSPIDKKNVQAAHRICNQKKGNRIAPKPETIRPFPTTRDWKS